MANKTISYLEQKDLDEYEKLQAEHAKRLGLRRVSSADFFRELLKVFKKSIDKKV